MFLWKASCSCVMSSFSSFVRVSFRVLLTVSFFPLSCFCLSFGFTYMGLLFGSPLACGGRPACWTVVPWSCEGRPAPAGGPPVSVQPASPWGAQRRPRHTQVRMRRLLAFKTPRGEGSGVMGVVWALQVTMFSSCCFPLTVTCVWCPKLWLFLG